MCCLSFWVIQTRELEVPHPVLSLSKYLIKHEFIYGLLESLNLFFKLLLFSIIERVYSDDYHPDENIATSKGIYLINQYLSDLCDSKSDKSLNWRHFVENMPAPYSRISRLVCGPTEDFLSKIIAELHLSLLENHSKYITVSRIVALVL